MAQETEHLEQIQEQVHDADINLFASKIAYKELERSQTKELNEKRSELQSVRQEIASVTDKANEAVELLGNAFRKVSGKLVTICTKKSDTSIF